MTFTDRTRDDGRTELPAGPQPTASGAPRWSRRDVLATALPAGLLLALGRETMAAPPSSGALRPIQGVYAPPRRHWVGDGFHVAGYFSVVPDASRRLDPFLLLDYNAPVLHPPTTRRRGVGPHPHRGFETVTFAFQGSVAHHDSTGAGGVIGPGDVQWMTAGAGILHKEYHAEGYARRGGPFQMAQLWVNLPRAHKWTPPRYQAIEAARMGVVSLPGGAGDVRVLAGEHAGARGPARTFTPITVLDLRLAAGKQHQISTPEGHTAVLLLLEGEVVLQGSWRASADHLVLFERRGDRITVDAVRDARVLYLGGAPIGEPIAQRGPFVMNTNEEIAQAYADLKAGKFGYLAD